MKTCCAVVVFLQNVGTAEDIDKGMRLGTNQPMGPLRLADFIGKGMQLLQQRFVARQQQLTAGRTLSLCSAGQGVGRCAGHPKALADAV